MFRAWYVPFYGYGVIHGDPHLGNYTVRDDLDLNLLDFGCIRVFRPRFVKGVIDLYWALARNDRDLAVDAYESWGFAKLDNATVDVLNEWAAYLYGPLMEDRARSIEETNSSHQGRRVVERVHQRLREVGGVTPPREFVFMDRAAIGLGAVFLHLKAEVNWHRLFMELIADFDVAQLEQRQTEALTRQRPAAADLRPRDRSPGRPCSTPAMPAAAPSGARSVGPARSGLSSDLELYGTCSPSGACPL